MNKNLVFNLAFIFLLTVSIFSVVKYSVSLKEKNDLVLSLEDTKGRLVAIESEKQNLLQSLKIEKAAEEKLVQENSLLKDTIEEGKARLEKLAQDMSAAQDSLKELNAQFSIAKAQNEALLEKGEMLQQKIAQLDQENDSFKSRFSSVEDLKKAIRELKKNKRRPVVESVLQKKFEAQMIEERVIAGNGGYLVKNGKFTYPSRIKIEVVPALSKE